ncbi:hypothetical protein CFP56_020365 [Quercus suber]|uniref:Uncharacterized protein n=1 Tax=Quercus suber TaxID=58331 RepID=A0AAW0KH83_QUESU
MPLGLGHLISLEILPLFFVRQKARSGGGLSELKQLSNLRGRLEIKYLGHGRDDMAPQIRRGNSQHLQELELWWDEESVGWWRNSDDNHLLLPSFPPSLSHLQIIECPNLTSMPLIPDLTSLKLESASSEAEQRLRSTNVDIHKSGDNIYLCWRKVKNSVSGAHCCVQGKLVLAPLMEFETSTTKNLFVWMEATVSSLNRLVKLSINEELVTKASSFHMPYKSKISEAMRTYIFLAAIEVKVNCRKRISEALNFPPLPPSGYIDENAYVLGSLITQII